MECGLAAENTNLLIFQFSFFKISRCPSGQTCSKRLLRTATDLKPTTYNRKKKSAQGPPSKPILLCLAPVYCFVSVDFLIPSLSLVSLFFFFLSWRVDSSWLYSHIIVRYRRVFWPFVLYLLRPRAKSQQVAISYKCETRPLKKPIKPSTSHINRFSFQAHILQNHLPVSTLLDDPPPVRSPLNTNANTDDDPLAWWQLLHVCTLIQVEMNNNPSIEAGQKRQD